MLNGHTGIRVSFYFPIIIATADCRFRPRLEYRSPYRYALRVELSTYAS